MYKLIFKRVTDITLSLVLLFAASPIILLTIFVLYITNQKKVFFFQYRPGINNKIFKIIKFKTMNDKRDKNGHLLPDHIRLTTFGKLVRKLSIDELPQLINVLKGDMSLIGPRPLLVEYLDYYNSEQIKRHEVRPGITGWAQVNGRNSISWEDKFKLDVWYVNNLSLKIDIKIFLLTLFKILKRDDINNAEQVTMPLFKGGNK